MRAFSRRQLLALGTTLPFALPQGGSTQAAVAGVIWCGTNGLVHGEDSHVTEPLFDYAAALTAIGWHVTVLAPIVIDVADGDHDGEKPCEHLRPLRRLLDDVRY
jgi:hypothetical protein